MLEVQVLAEDWRIEYNTYRPHGSLDFLTPRPTGSNGPTKRARPHQRSHKPWHHNRGPVTRNRTSRNEKVVGSILTGGSNLRKPLTSATR